ncbi:MAG: hypothetical protein HQ547_03030 [Candidatus Omnitrophica bacterium]|nr:hypothetical protein [Candidatus Omnitrophota bacterium]
MMRPNVLASKIIALVISILFITPTITWPAPESCLRQLPLLERSTLDAKIAKAKEDLAQLNSFAGDYSRQLDNVKAQIAESPTIASKKLFGLVAERLMFILKDMKAVKEYIIANDSARSPPNINFQDYSDIPMAVSIGPEGYEVVTHNLFPTENIRRASDASSIGMRRMPKVINVLMAGGAGTRLQELYTMSEGQRQQIGAGDLKKAELKSISKPTVPYSKIMHKSPITVILESLRRIAQDTDDSPVVVIVGPDTRRPILEALRKNNYFGLKTVIIKDQSAVPVYKTYDADGAVMSWGPIESEPDGTFIEAPDGGGGTVMALGNKGMLLVQNGQEALVAEETPLEWLDANYPEVEDANFLQTDMALEPEIISGLVGTREATGSELSAIGYDYPRTVSVKTKKDDAGNITGIYVEDEFTLGTFFSTDPDSAAIVEYFERNNGLQDLVYRTRWGVGKGVLQDRLSEMVETMGGLEAINAESEELKAGAIQHLQEEINGLLASSQAQATNPELVIPANTGAYNLSMENLKAVIETRKLKPFVQSKKSRNKKDGTKVQTDNLELPIQRLPEILGSTSVALVDEGDALPTKDARKFVESRDHYASKHMARLQQEFGIPGENIGEGTVVEISPLARAKIDPTLRFGRNAGLYLGGSYLGNGFEINIGRNVKIGDDTTVIIEGNGPVTIEDGVEFFNGGVVVIKASKDGEPVRIKKGQRIKGRQEVELRAAEVVDRVFARLAGPVIITDIRNARGELVVPGALTIIDQALEAEGFVRPEGQEHFLSIGHTRYLLSEALKKDKFLVKENRYFTIRDEGKEKRVRRIVHHNRLYQEIIHEGKAELSDEEIDYLFNNLSENTLGRYILIYLRATNGNDNPALWARIVARAGELSLSGEALRTWEDVQNTMINERSRLEIGNPDRAPFGDIDMIDYDKLQDDIWQRTTAGVFSVSGIRQIFDPFFGDRPLPLRFPWRLGIGTEPTMAAKVHAATQAELFAQMLQDPSGFAERIPRLADQTVEQHKQNKSDFVSLLEKTQASKTKRKRKKITVLLDTRSTGPALADVDIRTLIAEGVDVEYAFVASVDEAAVYVKDNPDIDGCIYISASHNDEGYNGIKLLLGDGRVMPEPVAYPYIFVLCGSHPSVRKGRVKGVLENASHTRDVIAKVSSIDPKDVRAVYERIPQVKQQSQQADWNYRDRIIAGVSTNQQAQAPIAEIRDMISRLKLAVISDPNGGAREDMGYLDALGIKTYRLNPRPRYDMDHELCPSTAAVAETTEALESIRDIAVRQGYTVIGSLHNDTDGDRRNYRPIDLKGEFSLRDDMVQICFALDVISYALSEYDFEKNQPKRILGVSCNGPTGVLLEELAEVLGFVVIRTQTGEAYVADGMERLSNMTWAELKEAAESGEEEIIIPDSVRQQFDASHDGEKIKVIVGGEGSNGSDFTPDLLVRDPIHTIKSLINFLSPATGKQFMRALLRRLGREDEFDESWWDTGEGMATIMHRVISYLPASKTTDFFTVGGEGEMINPPLIVGLIKDTVDDVFESDFRESALSGLAGIWGVSKEDISYEYVNYEERAKPGRGNRREKPPMRRQIGDGGYKIKFYIHRGGKKIPIGWIWFRDSITEIGLTRLGASAVFPSSITGVQPDQQQEIVDKTYGFLKTTLGNVLQRTVAKTSEQILTADLGNLSPALRPYQKVLPAAQKDLRDYMQQKGISSPATPVSSAEMEQAHDAKTAAAAAI